MERSKWTQIVNRADALGRTVGFLLFLSVVLLIQWSILAIPMVVGLRFLAHELVFVLLPGSLLYLAVSRKRRGFLQVLAVGWPLGYGMSAAAYALLGAMGIREAYSLYPLLAPSLWIALCGIRRRSRSATVQRSPRIPLRYCILVLCLCAFAVTLVAVSPLGLTSYSLQAVGPWTCQTDPLFDASLAGSLKATWPPTSPSMVGIPVRYQLLLHLHVAAAAQVTDLPTTVLLLRLVAPLLVSIVVIQLFSLGKIVARSWLAGGGTVLLVLAVREIARPDSAGSLFGNWAFLGNLVSRPPFLMGMVFALAIALEIGTYLSADEKAAENGSARERHRWLRGMDWKSYLVPLLLLLAATWAHIAVPAIVVSALCFFTVLDWFLHKRLNRLAASLAILAIVVVAPLFLLNYSNSLSNAVSIEPFHVLDTYSRAWRLLSDASSGMPPALWHVLRGAFALLAIGGFMGPVMLGFIGRLLAAGIKRIQDSEVWLISLAVVGVTASLVFAQRGSSEVYLLLYGFVFLAPVGWNGISILVAHKGTGWGRRVYGIVSLGITLVVFVMTADTLYSPRHNPSLLIDHRPTPPGISTESTLYDGLVWIRENTPVDAVISNNHWEPRMFCYSAISERQFVLESWVYSGGEGVEVETRTRLLDSVFRLADPEALAEVRHRYGATYLMVDKLKGQPATPMLGDHATLEYTSPEVDVYLLGGQ